MDNYCLLTNDVETTSIWFNKLRDETGLKVLREGMPVLLDIYARHDIKSTFFFTGYIARLYPDIVKMVLPFGHEVGSHAMYHNVKDGFDILNLSSQIQQLSESKKILEDISGTEVISFRSPALRVNRHTARALMETGFKIDSSIASTRFDAFMSFGTRQKLKWLLAPRKPYITRDDNLAKKGNSGIIEVPLSATLLPYVGTTMRILPNITKLQHHVLNFETKRIRNKPIVFDIHPNEFIDESDEKREISRRSKRYFSYLLKDLVRSKLKTKNLGVKAIPLYEKEIQFFQKQGYSFETMKDYCFKSNLL